jgi:predicted Zn finger-like uncharacterized protein
MKITCQSCQAKYTIADEKVAGKTVKIKCKKCGATIVVNGADAAAPQPMPYQAPAAQMASAPPGEEDDGDGATRVFAEGSGQPGGAPGGGEWTVSVTDDDQRTLTAPQIVEEYRRGVVNGDTYVWKDGMADWLPLSGVPELMGMISAPPGPAAGGAFQGTMAMPAQPQMAPSPVAMPSPMAASPMAAAPMMAEPAGGLGGTMIMPEGAPAPMAVAAPAAARKKGGTGGVDLFAPGASDPAPAVAHTATTSADRLVGERNENSVLFSISALTAAAAAQNKADPFDLGPAPGPRNGGGGGSVDDLMNLGGGLSAPVLAPPPLLAPVVEAPPPPAPVAAAPAPMMMMPEAPPKKSNTGLIIGLVAGVAVLASVGTFFAVSGGGKTTPDATNATGTSTAAAETATAAQTAAPAATATQAPAAETATAAPATAEPASTGPVAAAPVKGGPAPVGGPARHDAKKDDKKDDKKKDDKKKDDKKKDEPAPAAGGKEFDRGAALASLSGAAAAARGCKKADTPTGSGRVRITFATSGRVTSATLESGPWAGTSAAGCIVGAFRGASVPPFSGAPVSVSKTVSIH